MSPTPELPRWIGLREALSIFAVARDGTQGQRHIKPLHWYVACRLVVEGGFDPNNVVPRPPFVVEKRRGRGNQLILDPGSAISGERTLLGGLKTKAVDVVVSLDGIGPCVAVSMKGTLNAFRNLTNRMEEAVGDCTNIHIAYPALVYAFWNVLRANKQGPVPENTPKAIGIDENGHYKPADVAVHSDGSATSQIERYHFALDGLSGRSSIREEPSLYEAVGMTLVEAESGRLGNVFQDYPEVGSPLLVDGMFSALYEQYDLRFIYQAPALVSRTQRLEWAPDSPALKTLPVEYAPRVAAG